MQTNKRECVFEVSIQQLGLTQRQAAFLDQGYLEDIRPRNSVVFAHCTVCRGLLSQGALASAVVLTFAFTSLFTGCMKI